MKTHVSSASEDINAVINRMSKVQIKKLLERYGFTIHDSASLKELRRDVKTKVSDAAMSHLA